MAEPTKKLIYNVDSGKEIEYTLEVDENNEILAMADNGSFLKFPNVSEAEVDALIAKHNEQAATQVKKQPLFGAPEINEDTEPAVS